MTLLEMVRLAAQPKALLPVAEFRRVQRIAVVMTRRAVREYDRQQVAATWREDLRKSAALPSQAFKDCAVVNGVMTDLTAKPHWSTE